MENAEVKDLLDHPDYDRVYGVVVPPVSKKASVISIYDGPYEGRRFEIVPADCVAHTVRAPNLIDVIVGTVHRPSGRIIAWDFWRSEAA